LDQRRNQKKQLMKKVVLILSILFVAQLAYCQSAISVTKSGTGNPILFLTGFTSPGSVWDETILNLDGTYETHVVSYAGFNGLEPIGTPWYHPIHGMPTSKTVFETLHRDYYAMVHQLCLGFMKRRP